MYDEMGDEKEIDLPLAFKVLHNIEEPVIYILPVTKLNFDLV